ncbi:MAG: hypothetical protein E7673_05905 [Ruminococcaceae bacterium]|nr:hypothetical protein [Oscillospiraceae bacterium]
MSYEINKQALNLLNKQDWFKAQTLFFENAKKHPSYQTYNNLGYYLISEGLTCKNGKVRNALNLGLNYLKKSANMKKTLVNCFATIDAIDHLLNINKKNKNELCQYVCEYLKEMLSVEHSDKIHYNYLRFLYIWSPENDEIGDSIRNIVKDNPFSEAVSLYFELVLRKGMIKEALEIISNFPQYLDEIDLLMFYTKFEMYEQGYVLCEKVFNSYSLNEFIVSAMIQCCIAVENFELAKKYSDEFLKVGISKRRSKRRFEPLISSTSRRKQYISEYKNVPPALNQCAYFGCPMHNTEW